MKFKIQAFADQRHNQFKASFEQFVYFNNAAEGQHEHIIERDILVFQFYWLMELAKDLP